MTIEIIENLRLQIAASYETMREVAGHPYSEILKGDIKRLSERYVELPRVVLRPPKSKQD